MWFELYNYDYNHDYNYKPNNLARLKVGSTLNLQSFRTFRCGLQLSETISGTLFEITKLYDTSLAPGRWLQPLRAGCFCLVDKLFR